VFQGAIDRQRGHLFPWAPVALAVGVGTYFGLPVEPDLAVWWGIAALGLPVLALVVLTRGRVPLLLALLLALTGFGIAAAKTWRVAAPVLEFRYYGPIEGRIVHVDRSHSDKPRLTLDQVVLERMSPDRTPERVRVSLHGDQGFITPVPGLRVILTGHLGGPEGPVEPGGFDFQRHAWFKQLGAVGYTRTPALALAPASEGRAGLLVHRTRAAISAHVQEVLPGRTGAFAAAITTGDRSAMDEPTLEALRISNLAHLLAISGLHMGMLTGFIFGVVRLGLALWPYAALNWPTHRIAALVALGAGAFYLALSGGNVATERAFFMVAVMLVAILFDRRALTLRAVAFAALIVLVFEPDALAGPGFQMSFSATAALIWVFSQLREGDVRSRSKVVNWIFALVVSSAVAGLATAPFAAAHFNRIPHYGLLANIVSVPVMGAVIMPAAVLAALLAPLGLSWVGLKIMAPAIDWILSVAERVAALEGAVSHVPSPQAQVLPLLALGGIWLILWQGRARLAGILPMAVALMLWSQVERPALLISADGSLVGLMTPQGRALSKPKGQGFSAESWLENDGDPATQAQAAERTGFGGDRGALVFELAGQDIRHFTGRGAADRALESCGQGGIVIVAAETEPAEGCDLIDRTRLRQSGAMALYVSDRKLRRLATKDNPRPWNGRAQPKARKP
jgi:competence protein ComEC